MRDRINDKSKIELTTKQEAKRVFEILNVIGYGATCIVYSGCFYDEYSIRHYVKIKECCPLSGVSGREKNRILWNSEADKSKAISSFEKMYARHMKLQELYDVVNTTCKIIDLLYYGNDSVYLIMESDNGDSFDNGVPDSLYEILQAIYALSNTIGKYHEIGFLHLDIKPQNFMVIPETKELVKLFDFDSFVSINDISLGIADDISYSNEWAAPEVRQKKVSKIRETADVYSVGTILFYALYRRHLEIEDKINFGKYDFNNIHALKRVNPLIKRKLQEFFIKTLNPVISKRFQNMKEVMAALKDMLEIADPSKYYLCSSIPEQINYFGGRKTELVQARHILSDKKRVIISGMGGIGKSEFSKRYAHKYKEEYSSVVWIKCESSFAKTLTLESNFVIACAGKERNNQENYSGYQEKLAAIAAVIDENTLIVIDDIKDFSEKALLEFLKLQCNIMIATRINTSQILSDIARINLGCMDISELRPIFDHYYKLLISEEESEIVDEIIMHLDGYTLLVPIIAKQMLVSSIRPTEMFSRLKSQGISISLSEKVQHFKDEILIDDVLIGHLNQVFHVSDMDEDKLLVLRVLSMLDNINVGKKSLAMWCGFYKWTDMTYKYMPYLERISDAVDVSVVNSLIDSGWIQYDEYTDRISIHDIVFELVKTEYPANISTCKPFLDTMLKIADDIKGWKEEYDSGYVELYSILNEYTVDMYLDVIETFFLNLQTYNKDIDEILLRIVEKLYKVNDSKVIGIIEYLIRSENIYCEKKNISLLRKMQVFIYFHRYIIAFSSEYKGRMEEFHKLKISNATKVLKESVRDIRKAFKKPETYTALLELFEGPLYICDYYHSLFNENNEDLDQYRYLLRLLNEIIKNAEEKDRERALEIKTILKTERKRYLTFIKEMNTQSYSSGLEMDNVDMYSARLRDNWNKLYQSFQIISEVMVDEVVSISGKQFAISEAGYNMAEGLFLIRMPFLDNDEKKQFKDTLLSPVELEAASYLRKMWSDGLFKESMTWNLVGKIEDAVTRQWIYSNHKRGFVIEFSRMLDRIKRGYREDLFLINLDVTRYRNTCRIYECFDLDILALCLYRAVDKYIIGDADSYYFSDPGNSYSWFISEALDCAERMEDYESYYYFWKRRRDNLKADFDFDGDSKPFLVEGNDTFNKWEMYIQKIKDAENAEEIDAIYEIVKTDHRFATKAKQLILEVLDEKVTLKYIRLSENIPAKCIPDNELCLELEKKYADGYDGTLLELIDDYGEIVFQNMLLHNTEALLIWVDRYIGLIEQIRDLEQDAVTIERYYFLPITLIDFDEDALGEHIFQEMINQWLDSSIEKFNYYALKINESYIDEIYGFAGNEEQKEKYRKIKEALTNNWMGEDHLDQYI